MTEERGSVRGRALRDALLAGVVVAAGAVGLVTLDGAERGTAAVRGWEHLEFDDLFLSVCLALLSCGWFAWRRWRDAVRELRARRASEAQNALYVRRLEQLSGQLLEAEQDARARWADVLHDELGQTLYAVRLSLDALAPRIRDSAARAQFEHVLELVDDLLSRTRDLTFELTPPVLHDFGLHEALEWLAARTQARAQFDVRVLDGEAWRRIPEPWREPLFQSVRELIANAVKHARASRVEVSAAHGGDGGLCVRVYDDGCGFVYDEKARRGFGLFSTERRMAWLGARMRVESALGAGTVVTLELPRIPIQDTASRFRAAEVPV